MLLANQDAERAPIHVTVIGAYANPDAVALHTAALRAITSHELIEVRDLADTSLPPSTVEFPQLSRPALFLCTATACSTPIFHAEDVRAKIARALLNSR